MEALYEPPQEGTHEGFELLEDPRAERVEELAAALRLKRVGWIFAHPPREKGFVFSGLEVLTVRVCVGWFGGFMGRRRLWWWWVVVD